MNTETEGDVYGEIHETTIPLPSWLDGQTQYSAIVQGMRRFGHRKSQGWREFLPDGKRGQYIWDDGNTVLKKINQLALGLRSLGYKKGDMIGIMSRNRPEWTIADIACSSQGYVVVPIYDSYGPDNCRYIIQSTEQVSIFAMHKHLPFLKEACAQCPTVKHVILFDGIPEDEAFIDSIENSRDPSIRTDPKTLGFTHLYSEVMKRGADLLAENPDQPIEDPTCKYDELASIVYTSGTQGTPKGAMLTHNTILKGGVSYIGRASNRPEQDVIISYLPLAHIFQRAIEIMSLTHGIGIGYFSGSIPGLTEDLALLHPTLFPVVPRVLSKIYSVIKDQTAKQPFLARVLFKTALYLRRKEKTSGWPTHWLSNIVLGRIHAKFGGKLRITFSGSAPLSTEVGEFLDLVLGERLLEGYGCTEACGASFAMLEEDPYFGSVGAILPGVKCRLRSVPEMGYLVTNDPPTGEVCLGGPIFRGYWKDPEATAEAIKDGWLHTGDVGQWTPEGNMKIIDRLKNVFKLQQGEFVYLDDIERGLSTMTYVAQIMLYGNSLMNGLCAIVVPSRKEFMHWAEQEHLFTPATPGSYTDEEFAAVCALPQANEFIRKGIETEMRAQSRKGFEIPRMIHLTPIEFSIENGQLTPTMKTRRDVIKKTYAKVLDEMASKLR